MKERSITAIGVIGPSSSKRMVNPLRRNRHRAFISCAYPKVYAGYSFTVFFAKYRLSSSTGTVG
jgi:hypothetical protein